MKMVKSTFASDVTARPLVSFISGTFLCVFELREVRAGSRRLVPVQRASLAYGSVKDADQVKGARFSCIRSRRVARRVL